MQIRCCYIIKWSKYRQVGEFRKKEAQLVKVMKFRACRWVKNSMKRLAEPLKLHDAKINDKTIDDKRD